MTTVTYYMPEGHLPATIVQVKTEASKLQDHDDALIEYEYKEQVEGFQEEGKTTILARRAYIRAQKDGAVARVLVSKGDIIKDSRYHYTRRFFRFGRELLLSVYC